MTTPVPGAPLEFPRVIVRPGLMALVCLLLAGLAIGLSALAGSVMFGVWFSVGILLGLVNALLVQRSVTAITNEPNPLKHKMVLNSASRLLIITTVGLVIAYIFRPLGLGVVFGLAAFQVYLVLSTTLPVLKKLRSGELDAPFEGTERPEPIPSREPIIFRD